MIKSSELTYRVTTRRGDPELDEEIPGQYHVDE